MAKSSTALSAYRAGIRAAKPRSHRRAKAGISLAIVAGFAPTAVYAFQGFRDQGAMEGVARISARLTGYSPTENKFKFNELAAGWLPILAGGLAHKIANRMGINRQLRKATMGWISI